MQDSKKETGTNLRDNLFYTIEFVWVQQLAIDIVFFHNIPTTLSNVLQYAIGLGFLFKNTLTNIQG